MENDKKATARAALTKYIEENNCRKTTERFALLDTIYDIDYGRACGAYGGAELPCEQSHALQLAQSVC